MLVKILVIKYVSLVIETFIINHHNTNKPYLLIYTEYSQYYDIIYN